MLTSGSGASRNRKTPPVDGTFQETVCTVSYTHLTLPTNSRV